MDPGRGNAGAHRDVAIGLKDRLLSGVRNPHQGTNTLQSLVQRFRVNGMFLG